MKPIELDAKVPTQYELREGDLLLTRSNTRLLVGDVCCVSNVRPRTIMSDLIYRLGCRSSILPKFAMYFLLSPSGRKQIEKDARGSSGTMPKLAQQHIKSWRIPTPDVAQQRAIVGHIDAESGLLKLAMEKATAEIDLIREYRTRLVADVVTGQLDVRQHPWANTDLVQEEAVLAAVPDDREQEMLDETGSEELSE